MEIVVKFLNICNRLSPLKLHTEGRGRQKTFSGQLRGFWPLKWKKVHRNLRNVENKGLH